jgi:hypothetical protein
MGLEMWGYGEGKRQQGVLLLLVNVLQKVPGWVPVWVVLDLEIV